MISWRRPTPVFINLLRLRDINDTAFRWALEKCSLSYGTEAELKELSENFNYDLIRYGDLLIFRSPGEVVFWNPQTGGFEEHEDIATELDGIKNPLR